MQLDGIHHITAITADAQANVDFYVGVLGLRLVKKTVNQDNADVYHLFYADEQGSSGSDLTFFELPGAAVGRAGAGMVHRVVWRIGAFDGLDFWLDRLNGAGLNARIEGDGVRLEDHGDEPLMATHDDIPENAALRGFDGVRAFAQTPERSRQVLQDTLGFVPREQGVGEPRRKAWWVLRLRQPTC